MYWETSFKLPLLVEPTTKTALAYWHYDPPCAFFFGRGQKGYLKRNPLVVNDYRWVDDPDKNPFKDDSPKETGTEIFVTKIKIPFTFSLLIREKWDEG